MLDGRVSGIGVLATRRYAMFGGALCIYPPSASPYRRGLATPLRVARSATLRCRPLSRLRRLQVFTASEVAHYPHVRTGLRFSGKRTRVRRRSARVGEDRERRIRTVAHIRDRRVEKR